jgi:hypothetical protein
MNYSKKEKQTCAKGGRKSHASLKCCWQLPLKLSKGKDVG